MNEHIILSCFAVRACPLELPLLPTTSLGSKLKLVRSIAIFAFHVNINIYLQRGNSLRPPILVCFLACFLAYVLGKSVFGVSEAFRHVLSMYILALSLQACVLSLL